MSEATNNDSNRISSGSTGGVDTAGIWDEQHGCLQPLIDGASRVGRAVKDFFARIGSSISGAFSRLAGRVRNSERNGVSGNVAGSSESAPVGPSLKQLGEQRYAEVINGLDVGKAKAGAWRENVTAWKEAGGPDPDEHFSFDNLARDEKKVLDETRADYGNQPHHSLPALNRLYSDCLVIARLDVKIEAYPDDSRVPAWKHERADLQQDVDTVLATGRVPSDHENRRIPV